MPWRPPNVSTGHDRQKPTAHAPRLPMRPPKSALPTSNFGGWTCWSARWMPACRRAGVRRASRRRQGGGSSGAPGRGIGGTRRAARTTRRHHRPRRRCARAHAPAGQRSRRRPRRAERRARGDGDTEPPDRHPGARRTERLRTRSEPARAARDRSECRSRHRHWRRRDRARPGRAARGAADESSRWRLVGAARSRRTLRPPTSRISTASAAKIAEAQELDVEHQGEGCGAGVPAGPDCRAGRSRRDAARGVRPGEQRAVPRSGDVPLDTLVLRARDTRRRPDGCVTKAATTVVDRT